MLQLQLGFGGHGPYRRLSFSDAGSKSGASPAAVCIGLSLERNEASGEIDSRGCGSKH
jgi:hypothetical protein